MRKSGHRSENELDKGRYGLNRRGFLKSAAVVGASSVINPVLADPIQEGLNTSDLVYLSPIKSNGGLSACQAEIWFVFDGVDIFVCSGTDSWRVDAAKQGLTMTQFWVGDLGQWKDTNGEYRNLPAMTGKASIETNPDEQARVLDLFGDKYPLAWIIWGPRFRKGMANGKRTMLRYRPVVT